MTTFPTFARRHAGFSLIEMIGVLAIIAVLAVVIVPRVFSTIASSRLTSAVGSVNSMKTAVTEFAAKYGTIPVTGGNSRIDDLLLTAGFTDQRFTTKIGTQPSNPPLVGATWTQGANGTWTAAGGVGQGTQARLICLASNQNAPATGNNYYLTGTTNLPTGSRVVSAVIPGLTAIEAHELSVRIDGPSNSQAAPGTADTSGKVIYAVPAGAGTYTAYIYLAHQ